MSTRKRHHIWCNYQNPLNPEQGAEDCEMCKDLHKSYPEKEDDPFGHKLQEEHFPNVRRVIES